MTERRWNLSDREREGRLVETIERLANENDALYKERTEARAWARYWKAADAANSSGRMEWPEAPAEEEPDWLTGEVGG